MSDGAHWLGSSAGANIEGDLTVLDWIFLISLQGWDEVVFGFWTDSDWILDWLMPDP